MKHRTIHIIILLFAALQAEAQLDIPGYIRTKFTSYCSTVPGEEIYIHTDRQEYAAGEDLWFGVRLFDRTSGNLSDAARIAYFELLNPESKPVIRKRVLLDKGYGPGHALIPDTLRSGMYTIVAYTSWMRNFLPFNCFMKQIRIYNPAGRNSFVMSRLLPDLKMAGTARLPLDPGITIDADSRQPDSLRITLETTEAFRKENKETVYLFIQNKGKINHLSTVTTDMPVTRISVARHELQPGISQVTVFDSKGPDCERFVYIPSPKKEVIRISSPDSCRRRGIIALDIDAGKANRDSSVNMSISVSLSSGSSDFPGMEDYLVFGSEFGIPPWTRIGGKKLTELPEPVMDSLMKTLSSNWINWERIFSEEEPYYRYPHEKEHHYIMGKLLNAGMEQSAADEKVLMSFLGGEPAFRYTTTDRYGNFNMELEIDDIPGEMIIQNDLASLSYRPVLEPSFQNISITEGFSDTAGFIPGSLKVLRNHMIRKIYGSSSSVPGTSGNKPPAGRFYGKPDFTLNMTEYITLDSIAEVFFELVPRVNLVYANRAFRMLVLDESGEKLEGVPFVMVNGVLIRDAAIIARINPDAVKKIDVVWDKYRIGNYIFNGIINIILKDAFTEELMPPDAVKLNYSVLEPDPVFLCPGSSAENSTVSTEADFRNTLYWNPSVKSRADGRTHLEFRAPDNGGEFTITVRGVQASGKVVEGQKRIRVN